MKAPPLLPEETLRRVLKVANLDGLSVMAVAGLLALASASAGDYNGAGVGLLVAAAGAIELHGAGLLKSGEKRGMSWVLASQPYLLVLLLGYCALRLWNYDPAELQAAMTSDLRKTLEASGYNEAVLLQKFYTTVYFVLAIGTLIFQGGMTLYYVRRKDAVGAALESGESEE
jgi:hypothetical protein